MPNRLNIKDSIQQWVDTVNSALDLPMVDGSFIVDETSWADNTLNITGGFIRSGTEIKNISGASLTIPLSSTVLVGPNTQTEVIEAHVNGTQPVSRFVPVYIVVTNNTRITSVTDARTWAFDDTTGTTNAINAHVAETDPHSQYATDQDLIDHTNAVDPHDQYYKDGDDVSAGNVTNSGGGDTRTLAGWVQQIKDILSTMLTKANNLSELTDKAAARSNLDVVQTTKVTQQTDGTGASQLPSGTNEQRPSTPNFGYIRGNTEITAPEWWNGSSWEPVGAGAKGNGGDQVFVENDQVVNNDYTIPSNKNAMTTGPITIADGVTVTVSDGARWIII